MADDRDAGPLSTLVGRTPQCALIAALLVDAQAGESGSLVIRGEPGIGKTALLEYAAARSGGIEVLTTVGIEAEADLAFAVRYGLLRAILGLRGFKMRLMRQRGGTCGPVLSAPDSGSPVKTIGGPSVRGAKTAFHTCRFAPILRLNPSFGTSALQRSDVDATDRRTGGFR